MRNESLYTSVERHIGIIEFGSLKANNLSSTLLDRFQKALLMLNEDPNVFVILLKSEGGETFCSGASFDELKSVQTLKEGVSFFSGFAKVINAIRVSEKPVIGRVQGKVVGGGIGLVAACDYTFSTEQASIRLSELNLGIGPFVISPAIIRKTGVNAFSELALTPKEWRNAYWAQKHNLYTRVFESIKDLDKELNCFLDNFSKYSLNALSEIKKSIWIDTLHWDTLLYDNAKVSATLLLSEFCQSKLKTL